MFSVSHDRRALNAMIDKLDNWGDFLEPAAKAFHEELTDEAKKNARKHRRSGRLEKLIVNRGVGRWGNEVSGLTVVKIIYATQANRANKYMSKASRTAQKGLLRRLSESWEAHFGHGVG